MVDFDKEEFSYLPKNLLNKFEVFPKSFYIVSTAHKTPLQMPTRSYLISSLQYLVWKTMSRFQNKAMTDFPLVIENMFFAQETPIPEDGKMFEYRETR